MTTLAIVKDWVHLIKTVGLLDQDIPDGFSNNPTTLLAFDAYYANKATTGFLHDQNVPFTVSCKSNNFKELVALVLPEGYNDRGAKTGDTHAIYNKVSGQVFVHHFDTQKGVGQKFNLSGQFVLSTKQADITKYLHEPPCYIFYKFMFGDVDLFNTFLKRVNWPHKRGGQTISGMEGSHHDYVMSSIFLNLYHMFLDITGFQKDELDMQKFLVNLSIVITMHAKGLVGKN